MVEKGQVQDWKKVKRTVRECAEIEDVHLTDKYKKVIKAGVVELGKEKMLLWNILHSKLLLMPLSSNLECCRTVVLVRKKLQVIVECVLGEGINCKDFA
eukprot:4943490-Ditylum_brightwellii.AAC.1